MCYLLSSSPWMAQEIQAVKYRSGQLQSVVSGVGLTDTPHRVLDTSQTAFVCNMFVSERKNVGFPFCS